MRQFLLLIFVFTFSNLVAQSDPTHRELIFGDPPFPSDLALDENTFDFLLTALPSAKGLMHEPARLLTLTPFSMTELNAFCAFGDALPLKANISSFVGPLHIYNYQVLIPAYTQGFFCNFEDYINKGRKLRLDFSVR